MHTLRDAHIFVVSLNEEQRRALAHGLILPSGYADDDGKAIAARLAELITLARALHHISLWQREGE